MKTINMGEKITLTALQLVYLLDEAMETLCLRAEDGQGVDTMVIAKEKLLLVSREGNYAGMLSKAQALYGQVGALCDLLGPVVAGQLTERRGN